MVDNAITGKGGVTVVRFLRALPRAAPLPIELSITPPF